MKKKLFFLFFIFAAINAGLFSQGKTPLDRFHSELEKILDKETLAQIDSYESQEKMVLLHHSLGMYLRNEYGLWSGDSELYRYLYDLGLRHPDDMSSVILESFWCKRHNVQFDIKAKVQFYEEYWQNAAEQSRKEKERKQAALNYINSHRVKLTYKEDNPQTISLPLLEKEPFFRARYLCKYDDGVFASIRRELDIKDPKPLYITQPYKIDLQTNKITAIKVKALDLVESCIVTDNTLWCYGKKGKKHKLVSVKNGKETIVPIPKEETCAILGFAGEELLIEYSREIYRYKDSQSWTLIYTSQEDLPRSGLPPQLYGNKLYLRDEGRGENGKNLWILNLDTCELEKFYEMTGLVGPDGPRWENNASYTLDEKGNLYVSCGEDYSQKSLLVLSNNNSLDIILYNNTFKSDLEAGPKLDISAVRKAGKNLLLAGYSGLFTLSDNILSPIVYFNNPEQDFAVDNGKYNYHREWHPSFILPLEEDDYILSRTFDGIFRLKKENGNWTLILIS